MNNTLTIQLPDLMNTCHARTQQIFLAYLQKDASPAPILQKAMAYSILNGGKRIRPLFVYAIGRSLGADWAALDLPACAVEMMHTYSLIHDDLPAMDNADLRRGQPACHQAFPEGMAILAGDTLQTLAFHCLARHPAPLTADQRINMIETLADASGLWGMAGGQALDISANTPLSRDALLTLYRLKTGALLTASAKMAVIAANPPQDKIMPAILQFADHIGLAFQIQDDILDIESHHNQIGKPQGLDQQNQKITYPHLCGIPEAQQFVAELFAEALQAITFLGEKSRLLAELADYLLHRNY